VSKATALLDAFLPRAERLSLPELAERSGLPPSTTYRLAGQLVEWGALARDEEGGYRIGVRLWEVGSVYVRTLPLPTVAAPYLRDLHVATRENVLLGVRDGLDVVWVDKVTGPGAARVRIAKGERAPAYATAAGKVLLAYAPAEVVRTLLSEPLHRFTSHTIVEPRRVVRTLAEIRRSGVGFARSELDPGHLSVAAPIWGADAAVIAALTVVVSSVRAKLERLAPAVQTAAAGVSRQLQPGTGLHLDDSDTARQVGSHSR
jgi:DNA-binding IclR family transcriptional regulator